MRGPMTAASARESPNSASFSVAPSAIHASALRMRNHSPVASRIPRFQPAPRPRLSCSTSRTSGNRSRTSSTVPSLEPWSTTIVSWPRTLSRHLSMYGIALKVTTIAETPAAMAA